MVLTKKKFRIGAEKTSKSPDFAGGHDDDVSSADIKY